MNSSWPPNSLGCVSHPYWSTSNTIPLNHYRLCPTHTQPEFQAYSSVSCLYLLYLERGGPPVTHLLKSARSPDAFISVRSIGECTPSSIATLILRPLLAGWNATPEKAPYLHAHWRSHHVPHRMASNNTERQEGLDPSHPPPLRSPGRKRSDSSTVQ